MLESAMCADYAGIAVSSLCTCTFWVKLYARTPITAGPITAVPWYIWLVDNI